MALFLRILQKKAEWKSLNEKTRTVTAKLIMYAVLFLITAMASVMAMQLNLPWAAAFKTLGFVSALAFPVLIFMGLLSNVAGVVITKVERYRITHPTEQKRVRVKRVFLTGMPVARVASYRTGRARSYRRARPAFAHASGGGDGSDDGGESDPPAPSPQFLALSFNSHCHSIELNNFPYPWRFNSGPGCWSLPFIVMSTGRGRTL